ncbi:hypothetical protein F4859DRAFT_529040 [Xylaria cf. heliscus]|nr:hypothetical protein F4859DRAFT_529040 [Xylaria cf. heliscus]
MSPSKGTTTLVVGIDFGTTYSGVSWLICKTGSPPGQPEVITSWQTYQDNRNSNSNRQKVPSVIHYDKNGELWWGFRVPAGVETVEWFKLLLLDDGDLQKHLKDSSHLLDAKQALVRLGKTPVQLVGEYLQVLWQHTLKQISRAKGEDLVRGMPFHVVLTVPAIWTDHARDRMREAATLAGILEHRDAGQTTISFISEPEAAAIATIPELENRPDLQVGDSFVVVDAGGGTVDVISYKINTVEPLSVSECVEGALCGGTFLDKAFEALLKHSVGEVSWNKMTGSDIRRMMNSEWEHGIKKSFHGEPDYYTVELPDRVRSHPVPFSSEELQPIFDKIISQTALLVERQIRAVKAKTSRLPKLMILVGGFGRSPYMFKYLKRNVDDRVVILQSDSEKPWTAICRGAAIFGAISTSTASDGPLVQSRVARLNYGWMFDERFKEGFHDQGDKYWDKFEEEWYATNQMQWVVRRGDDVSVKNPGIYDYIRKWDIDDQGLGVFTKNIYACADLNPPTRKQDNFSKIGEFTYQTLKPREQHKKVFNNGIRYREWHFGFKVMVSGASFDIALVSDGREQKLKKVVIDAN